eukprot:344942-Amphidinium_carterae.2
MGLPCQQSHRDMALLPNSTVNVRPIHSTLRGEDRRISYYNARSVCRRSLVTGPSQQHAALKTAI